jgi:thioredoxin 1
MSEKIIQLTSESFNLTIANNATPILVDFWAPWCGPCKAIAPILEQLATELEGKLTVAKVNIDDHESVATQFNIRAIPTMLVFKNGQLVETLVGMQTKDKLHAKLTPHLI